MEKLLFVMLTFAISAMTGWLMIPRIVIIAKMKRLFDKPNLRKVHTEAIPRLGGISFFPVAMFSFAITLGLRYYFGFELSLSMEGNLITEFLFVMAGMFAIFFVGFGDDLVGMSYKSKFVVQIFAGIMLVFAGVSISSLQGFLGITTIPFWASALLTILLCVFAINSFNLIDGVDGLCSGTGTIILTILGSWYIYMELYVYAMFAFGMAGVVLTFFQYNVMGKRLKVFMGDTGSLTLGYMIIFLAFKFIKIDTWSYPDVIHINSSLALVAGLFFVPLFDTIRVFTGRISKGKSPFYPDKTHVHHKLLRMKLSHLQSTGFLLMAQIVFVVLNILLSQILDLNITFVLMIDITLALLINYFMNRRLKFIEEPVTHHPTKQQNK